MNRTILTIAALTAVGALTACNPLVVTDTVPVHLDVSEAVIPADDGALPGEEAGNESPCIPRDEFGGDCAGGVPCTPRDEWGGACLPPYTPPTPAPCVPRDEFGGQCDPSLTDEELAQGGN